MAKIEVLGYFGILNSLYNSKLNEIGVLTIYFELHGQFLSWL